MKTTLALLFTVFALAIAHAADPAPPLTVAVLDFQASDKDLDHAGARSRDAARREASESPNVVLVERQELDKILSERELGKHGDE